MTMEENYVEKIIGMHKSKVADLGVEYNLIFQREENVQISPCFNKSGQRYVIKGFATNNDTAIRKSLIREISFALFEYIGLPISPIVAYCPFTDDNPAFILFKDMKGGFLSASIEKASRKETSAKDQSTYDADNTCPQDDEPTLTLDPTSITKIFYGLSFILCIIHQFKIAFRNLSPEYILLDEDAQPYLGGCDFTRLLEEKCHQFSAARGDPPYMSKELLLNENVTLKVDIFSFGVIMCHMISGRCTMDNVDVTHNGQEKMKKLHTEFHRTHDIPENLREPFRRFLENALSEDPEKRPDAFRICQQIQNHELVLDGCDVKQLDEYIAKLKKNVKRIKKGDFIKMYKELQRRLLDLFVGVTRNDEEEEEENEEGIETLEETDEYIQLP